MESYTLGSFGNIDFENVETRGLLAKLPSDCLIWSNGKNPTKQNPTAQLSRDRQTVTIFLKEDSDQENGRSAIGVKFLLGMITDFKSCSGPITFDYEGTRYTIFTRTIAGYN